MLSLGNKQSLYRTRPSAGTDSLDFLFRLLLAMASVVAYAVLVQLTPLLETVDTVPSANTPPPQRIPHCGWWFSLVRR